jgi:iron complex transport system substrate-binding protein
MRMLSILLTLFTLSTNPALADATANRIVIAGGDLAEIAFALGAGDRVAAVDSTSTWPPEAREKEQIGYVRRLASEGILAIKPDLVLAAYDAGPQIALDQLRSAGIRVAIAPEGKDVRGVAEKIRFVGRELGLAAEGDALASQVTTDLEAAIADAAKNTSRPRVVFLLSASETGLLAGGDGSSAGAIIEMAGGVNAVTGFDGYKLLSREALLQSRPDVLLMMNGSAHRSGGIDKVLDRPELLLTPAGQQRKAILMDGPLLLGFGPRTPQAVNELAAELRRHAN